MESIDYNQGKIISFSRRILTKLTTMHTMIKS